MKVQGIWRFVVVLASYYLLTGLFQLVIVSLISFFHFLLDHKLGVIEDWVFDKGWEIVLLVKISAFYVIQKFVHLPSLSRQPFRDLILETWKRPSRNLFALSVAAFFVILFFSSPEANIEHGANVFKSIMSYISSSIVILLDVLLLLSLRFHHGFGSWESRFAIILMAGLYSVGNNALFPFALDFGAREFFLHLTVLQLSLWGRDNWSDPAFFIGLVIAPMIAVLGFDPVWGSRFSLFASNQTADVSVAAGIWLLTSGFLWWRIKTEQIA